MSQFDPYVEWLGIRDSVRPPYHYRLLAVELFESNVDVIANAADRQMAFLRTFQSGGRVQESQQLLSELAAANACLLNPMRKSQYDAWLREDLRDRQGGSPNSERTAAQRASVNGMATLDSGTILVVTDANGNSSSVSSRLHRKKKNLAVPVSLGAVALLMIVAVLVMAIGLAQDSRKPDEVAKPNNQAQDEILRRVEEPTIDDPKPVDKSDAPKDIHPVQPLKPADKPTSVATSVGKPAWETPPTEAVRNAIDSFNQSREYKLTHDVLQLLNQTRTQFSQRQLKEAQAVLDEAKLVARTKDDQSEVARLEKLHQLLNEFWQEVDAQLAVMRPGDELSFADAGARLVSIDSEQFVLADGNAQQSFLRDHAQLPANVAVALVEAGPLQVADQLRIATFWVIDRAGDPRRAHFAANQAREQGLDADPILQEIAFNPDLVMVVGGPRVPLGEGKSVAGGRRLAVPSSEALNTALVELKNSLAAQYAIAETPAGRSHLVKTLLGRIDQQMDPATRYTMLFETQKLAIAGGDVASFLDATQQLAQRFEIDKGRFLAAGMARVAEKLADDDQRRIYFERGVPVVDELAAADEFLAAEALLKDLMSLSRVLNTVTAEQRRSLTDKRKSVAEAKATYERFAKAKEALTQSPDDPASNHIAGSYLAWHKGKLQDGLPHLAKSNDPRIKTAATIELTAPKTAVEQSSLADMWWRVAESESSSESITLAIQEHAASWYERALTGLSGEAAATAIARIEATRNRGKGAEVEPELFRSLIDDDMTGFNMTNPWSVGEAGGFKGRIRYQLPGNGRYQALWIFENVPRGKYHVYATWPSHNRLPEPRGTNVVYILKDNRREVGTETVSQALPARKDLVIQGHPFQRLGEVEMKSGVFKLLVTDVANGFVIADAVAIVQVE